jgi:hypothetical protein
MVIEDNLEVGSTSREDTTTLNNTSLTEDHQTMVTTEIKEKLVKEQLSNINLKEKLAASGAVDLPQEAVLERPQVAVTSMETQDPVSSQQMKDNE